MYPVVEFDKVQAGIEGSVERDGKANAARSCHAKNVLRSNAAARTSRSITQSLSTLWILGVLPVGTVVRRTTILTGRRRVASSR